MYIAATRVTGAAGIDIQAGEHDSVTDARATMAVFLKHRKLWEEHNRGVQQQKLARRKTNSAAHDDEPDSDVAPSAETGEQLDDDF